MYLFQHFIELRIGFENYLLILPTNVSAK